MNKKAAIYVRVSTDEQADKGYSLPSQIEACQKFAERLGFDLQGIYKDDISGAKPIVTRPEGSQLQKAIDTKQVRVVIIYCVDRLSRDIVDLLTTVRDWLRDGIEIYTLDMGQITSELDIVLVIKGWQGSDERKKIIERTSRGRYGKAKSGKAVGSGSSPYGYSYSNGELLINEDEAEIIKLIFRWYTEGDGSGECISIFQIGQRLSNMHIQTPSETRRVKMNHKRPSGIWNKATVGWILASETYCGVLRYGKFSGKGGHRGKRPDHEHITIEVPSIISRDVWLAAKTRREYNSLMAKRNSKRDYLLKGRLKCGCGGSMVGGHGNYYCAMRYNRYMGLETTCQEPTVKGWVIEPLLWGYVMELIKDPKQFEARLREAQSNELDEVEPKQKELSHVQALIKQTEQEADDIARAMSKVFGLVAQRLQNQASEVDRRYCALLERETELQEAITAQSLTDQKIKNLLDFRETVAAGLEHPTFEDKLIWLQILQVNAKISGSKAVITCRLPVDPKTVSVQPKNEPSIGSKTPRIVQLAG